MKTATIRNVTGRQRKEDMNITMGVERERFIVDCQSGKIVPVIGKLLPDVQKAGEERGLPSSLFSYELFAGQIEDRTPPCSSLIALRAALVANDKILTVTAKKNGLSFDFSEIVEEHQIANLEVNPFDQRHKNIWQSISEERKSAASRVAATHIHISVNKNQAVALLNICRKEEIERLTIIGDHSHGRRIETYRVMAQTEGTPPEFSSFEDLMAYIEKHGGEKNVWDLVRYKPSTGTVEFRMFGSTADVDEVIEYAQSCLTMLEKIITFSTTL